MEIRWCSSRAPAPPTNDWFICILPQSSPHSHDLPKIHYIHLSTWAQKKALLRCHQAVNIILVQLGSIHAGTFSTFPDKLGLFLPACCRKAWAVSMQSKVSLQLPTVPRPTQSYGKLPTALFKGPPPLNYLNHWFIT